MDKSYVKYLEDINIAILDIKSHLENSKSTTFAEFNANLTTKRAIEREFMIIGEALNKALRLNPDIKISDAKKIISLRSKIVHDYD